MNRFAALLDRLVYEPRRNAKIRLIADYLRTTPDPERGWALAALTGGLTFREAKAGLVRGLIQERTDPVLFEMSYAYVGDLAETVALLWPSLPVGEGGPGSAATGAGWGPWRGDDSASVAPHPTSSLRSEATLPDREGSPAPSSLPVGEGGPGSAATGAGWGPGGDDSASVAPHPTSSLRSEATLPYREGSPAPSSLPVGEGGPGSAATGAGWGPWRGDDSASVAPHPTSIASLAGHPPRQGGITLEHVVHTLSTVSKSDLPARLAGFLDALDETGRWALLKLITGSLRIGVSARLAKTAVSELGDVSPDDVEEVWHGLAPPYEDLFAWVEGRGQKPVSRDPAPFRPPMLAHPLELEDFDKLDAHAFAAEWKWDGIRVQAVGGRDGERTVTRLYSRTGEDVSTAFPDLVTALAGLDAAIDGELLVLVDGRVQSFNVLQQRLNRKSVSNALMRKYPAHLRAYDLLAHAGEDLRALPFAERRVRLEAFVARLGLPCLDLSPQVRFADWETLGGARAQPAAHGAGADADAVEGVMIKRTDSLYVPGRPKGLWFKWKREPFTVDAVLMYAQRGHGKRSSFYSDFTFGVWRPSEGGEELVPVGKAYFGFTDAELAELDRFVRNHTIGRFGPVREVVHTAETGLVLEIAFEGLQRSTRHKSGLAMRFPRVSRIRWDKPTREADRIETLEALLSKGELQRHPAG